jgi:hypothetical protein
MLQYWCIQVRRARRFFRPVTTSAATVVVRFDIGIAPFISNDEGIMAVKMWLCAELRRGWASTDAACWACGQETTLQRAARGGPSNYIFQKALRAFVHVPRFTMSKFPRCHLLLHICYARNLLGASLTQEAR